MAMSESSEDLVIRQLKTWALLGCDLDSKPEHKDAWEQVIEMTNAGALPSMPQLDSEAIEGYDI